MSASKRADGFHALESLVVFADVGDALDVPSVGRTVAVAARGRSPTASRRDDDNLVLRAARALAALNACGAAIVLTKNLPVASGIGGGSADAAATLRGAGVSGG